MERSLTFTPFQNRQYLIDKCSVIYFINRNVYIYMLNYSLVYCDLVMKPYIKFVWFTK